MANECAHNDSMAEAMSTKAALLIPLKYMPRYYLFNLYKRTGLKEKAATMASEIANMKIKVYSAEVNVIKKEMVNYLNNH
jgi:hypothetical protein